ncbi:hypothetical protein [Pseudoalteromonas sp.]|uniref:hypothetical protein n=1 Tax=Pseudoalteromonas sp. TaxID=53249 RepID=UPI003002F529
MKKRLLLSTAALSLLLAGCNLDNDKSEQQLQNYLVKHAGLYTSAYEKDGTAQLARLAINELGVTLVLTSDREVSTAHTGSVIKKNIVFSSQTNCQSADIGFNCIIDSQPVNLTKSEPRHYTAVNLLAGDYNVAGDNLVIDVNLDNQGTYVAQYQGCNITGSIGNEDTYFSITPFNSVCATENLAGIAFINNDNLGLEVYLPGNALSGEWIKM